MTATARSYLVRVWIGALSAVLFAFLLTALASGCAVPVHVRPEADAAGKPIPALVAIELRQDAQGRPIPLAVAETQPAPVQPRPEFADVASRAAPLPVPPPPFDWNNALTILGVVAGAVGGGWGLLAQRAIGMLKTAVRESADHGDRIERAETEKEIEQVKEDSEKNQKRAGVFTVIDAIRKPK